MPVRPGSPDEADDADDTRTVTGGDAGGASDAGDVGDAERVVRYGPGVPPAGSASAAPTAEEVWRAGPAGGPSGQARRRGRLRRLAGPALSVALLAASGTVIFLRLHHGPFGVTGVAVTAQAQHGCTADVTGRVGTTGAAGTVSYQWVFAPQAAARPALNQPVASGQSALYLTAAVEGQGHGTLTQTVTLRVLGPGHDSASARVVLRC